MLTVVTGNVELRNLLVISFRKYNMVYERSLGVYTGLKVNSCLRKFHFATNGKKESEFSTSPTSALDV